MKDDSTSDRWSLRPLAFFLFGVSIIGNILFAMSASMAVSSSSPTTYGNENDAIVKPSTKSRKAATVTHIDDDDTDIVGTFNGHDVIYRSSITMPQQGLYSSVKCIGDNFQRNASWIYRSCSFQNLCFDLEEKEFVLFRSPSEQKLTANYLKSKIQNDDDLDDGDIVLSSSHLMEDTTVSIGSLCDRWGWTPEGNPSLEWFPKILDTSPESGYYEIADLNTVFIPFQPLAGNNLGHLLWDTFLPIYSLLDLFQFANKNESLLLVRYNKLPTQRGNRTYQFGAACDVYHKCRPTFDKALPLLGIDSFATVKSSENSLLTLSAEAAPKSRYVCSKHGVAGFGMLTDHGFNTHGFFNNLQDFMNPHNIGRGAVLWNFRNYMMNNIGIKETPARLDDAARSMSQKKKILFSIMSSGSPVRQLKFKVHLEMLETKYSIEIARGEIELQTIRMSKLSLKEQIELMTQTHILVTSCGGGAVTSMFLPYGSHLILYYDNTRPSKKGKNVTTTSNRGNGVPGGKLDFAYFNNLAYITSHWLPIQPMNEAPSVNRFLELVDTLIHRAA